MASGGDTGDSVASGFSRTSLLMTDSTLTLDRVRALVTIPDEEMLVALLKDAHGLDRVHIFDLNSAYLRHDEARRMVSFAERLWEATDDRPPLGAGLFGWLFRQAQALSASPGAPPQRPSSPSSSDW